MKVPKGSSLLLIWPFTVAWFRLSFVVLPHPAFPCFYLPWPNLVPALGKDFFFFSHFINFWPWISWDSTPGSSSGTGATIWWLLNPQKLGKWMQNLLPSWETLPSSSARMTLCCPLLLPLSLHSPRHNWCPWFYFFHSPSFIKENLIHSDKALALNSPYAEDLKTTGLIGKV